MRVRARILITSSSATVLCRYVPQSGLKYLWVPGSTPIFLIGQRDFIFFHHFTILFYTTLHYSDLYSSPSNSVDRPINDSRPPPIIFTKTRTQAIYSKLKYRVKQTSAGVYSQKGYSKHNTFGHLPRTVQTPLLMSLGRSKVNNSPKPKNSF